MIVAPSAELNLLTYSSLKGFMITLNVKPRDSSYYGGIQGRRKVTSFLLKFAVITPRDNTGLPPYKGVRKSSESQDSFFEEAKLQQYVWVSSVLGNKPEICPPIANFAIFSIDASLELIKTIRGHHRASPEVIEIMSYFKTLLDTIPSVQLGLIVMPMIPARTLTQEIQKIKGTATFSRNNKTAYIKECYDCLAAQVVRLFIEIGVIHFDLHNSNSLIRDVGGSRESIIIDFGRASNILKQSDDDYLSWAGRRPTKQEILVEKEKFLQSYYLLQSNATEQQKSSFILDVIAYITMIDLKGNQRVFGSLRPQMSLSENIKGLNMSSAFDMLARNMLIRGTLTRSIMERKAEIGRVVDLRDPGRLLVRATHLPPPAAAASIRATPLPPPAAAASVIANGLAPISMQFPEASDTYNDRMLDLCLEEIEKIPENPSASSSDGISWADWERELHEMLAQQPQVEVQRERAAAEAAEAAEAAVAIDWADWAEVAAALDDSPRSEDWAEVAAALDDSPRPEDWAEAAAAFGEYPGPGGRKRKQTRSKKNKHRSKKNKHRSKKNKTRRKRRSKSK
jgi:hypothetical protein